MEDKGEQGTDGKQLDAATAINTTGASQGL